MKVSELIAALADFPPDALVVCQSDAEGNGYSPLAGVDEGDYQAESTWSGIILSDEDMEDEDCEYDTSNTERVVILFPVN